MDKTVQDRHNQQVIDYYDQKDKKTMAYTGNQYTQHHLDVFLEVTGIKPGDRVLDVGCGMGRYTIPLVKRGIQVEGLDISPFLLEKLKQNNDSGMDIPLHLLDIIDYLPEMVDKYDAVVGFFVLHHMHDIEKCYSAMAKVVKPGGLIAFLEPNAYNVLYYIQIMLTPMMTWQGDGGMAKMRPGIIFPAMRAAGLNDLSVYRYGFFPPFITNTPFGIKLEKVLERIPIWKPLLPAALFQCRRPK
jgi:SAM-dependent methyltransferase